MSDRAEKLANTAEAIRLLSTLAATIAELAIATTAINATIQKARSENRDLSDQELDAARSKSTLADERFAQAVAAAKA